MKGYGKVELEDGVIGAGVVSCRSCRSNLGRGNSEFFSVS